MADLVINLSNKRPFHHRCNFTTANMNASSWKLHKPAGLEMQLPVSAERNLEALPIPQHEIIMLAGYYETTIKEKLDLQILNYQIIT